MPGFQDDIVSTLIKHHLRVKPFSGRSENAVKSQLWIAISVYVPCAVVRKQLQSELGLHTIMQNLSPTLFERIPSCQPLVESEYTSEPSGLPSQLSLFDKTLGNSDILTWLAPIFRQSASQATEQGTFYPGFP